MKKRSIIIIETFCFESGKMTRRNVIFETPFPIYCVRILGDRHILVAGGGGQARTGVPNLVEIFLFDVHENSWDLVRTTILDTGIMATMNLDIFPLEVENGTYLLACGHEGTCRVYKIKFDVAVIVNGQLQLSDVSANSSGHGHSRRRNRSSTSESRLQNGYAPNNATLRKLGFSCEELKTFQSDCLSQSSLAKIGTAGAFQKVVRFHCTGNLLVTGGSDGHFRVWEWPSCKKLLDHNAHKDDVDDLDICPNGIRLVTVGRDGCGYVWQLKDATKLAALNQLDVTFLGSALPTSSRGSPPPGQKAATSGSNRPTRYRYRFCRFAPALSSARSHTFFTCAIPIVRNAKKQACYLSRWRLPMDGNKCQQMMVKVAPTNGEVVSAMCVSDNGASLGLGTLSGSVVIVETGNLTPLQMWKEAHEIFVTAVDFLPTNPSTRSAFSPLMTGSRCALVSCSAANCCQLHVVRQSQQAPLFFWTLFCGILILIILFYLFEFFEL